MAYVNNENLIYEGKVALRYGQNNSGKAYARATVKTEKGSFSFFVPTDKIASLANASEATVKVEGTIKINGNFTNLEPKTFELVGNATPGVETPVATPAQTETPATTATATIEEPFEPDPAPTAEELRRMAEAEDNKSSDFVPVSAEEVFDNSMLPSIEDVKNVAAKEEQKTETKVETKTSTDITYADVLNSEASDVDKIVGVVNLLPECYSSVINKMLELDDTKTKLATAPYGEPDSYAYEGGLAKAIVTAIRLTLSTNEALNTLTKYSLERTLAGVIVANLGRALCYEYDGTKVVETEIAHWEESSVVCRDLLVRAIMLVAPEKYNGYKELLNIVSGVKVTLAFGALSLSKTKIGSLVNHIWGMTYKAGFFQYAESCSDKCFDKKGTRFYLG